MSANLRKRAAELMNEARTLTNLIGVVDGLRKCNIMGHQWSVSTFERETLDVQLHCEVCRGTLVAAFPDEPTFTLSRGEDAVRYALSEIDMLAEVSMGNDTEEE
tara:strand:+ start:1026 stop:1337 length:312 start_codon:yes stop_codon:yes gene_type:complete